MEMNNRINRLHERALRIVHDYYKSSYEQLLKQEEFCDNTLALLTIISILNFQVQKEIIPEIMNNVFQSRYVAVV